jgi:HAE1 family hydrophobic/amphiphilic exporter-1
VAGALRTLVAGQTVGNWRAADGETYDVRVRLSPDAAIDRSDLQNLPLIVTAAADGSARVVRLSQVADVQPSTGPNQINRRDLTREINVDANVLGRSAGDVSAEIAPGSTPSPGRRATATSFGGSTKNMQDSFGYALARWHWPSCSST